MAACIEGNDESIKLPSGKYSLAMIEFESNPKEWNGFRYQGIINLYTASKSAYLDEDGLRAITDAEYGEDGVQIIINPEKVGNLPCRIKKLAIRIGSGVNFPMTWSAISMKGVKSKNVLNVTAIPTSNGVLSNLPLSVIGNFILYASEGPVGSYRYPLKSFIGCPKYVSGNCTILYGYWCEDPLPPDFTGCPEYVGGDFILSMNPNTNGLNSLYTTFKSGTGLPLEVRGCVDIHASRDVVKRTYRDAGLLPLCPDGKQRKWSLCKLYIPRTYGYYETNDSGGTYKQSQINDKKAQVLLNLDDEKINTLLTGIDITHEPKIVYFLPSRRRY